MIDDRATNPVVNPKPDEDEVRQEISLDEDDPDGGEVMNIDKALKDTGQAPHASKPDREMVTEPVDHPPMHINKNVQE